MLSITLKQLEFFVSIVETKSFSKTADLLSFSQPAISSSIAQLEENLQTELLDRSNRKRIEITEDGRIFYERAKEILANCYTLQESSLNKSDADTIAIGAHNIPAHYMLSDVINYYKKIKPETRFFLKECSDLDVLTLLSERKIDIGIVSQRANSRKWKTLPIYDDSIVLGLPNTPRYRCFLMKRPTIYDLLESEALVWNQSIDKLVCDYLSEISLKKEELNIIAEMSSEQLAKTSVTDGLGIAFLSRLSLKCAIHSGEILTYELPHPPVRTIRVIYDPSGYLNQAEKSFVKFLGSGTFDFEKCNH